MFSANEHIVIKILGRKKMSIREITQRFYALDYEPKINDNNYIASVVRRIKHKCENNEVNWTIAGSGCGRRGRTVWKEKR